MTTPQNFTTSIHLRTEYPIGDVRRLPFIGDFTKAERSARAKRGHKVSTRNFWAPGPKLPVSRYEEACARGAELGGAYLRFVRESPESDLLATIVLDMPDKNDGYVVGFIGVLTDVLQAGMTHLSPEQIDAHGNRRAEAARGQRLETDDRTSRRQTLPPTAPPQQPPSGVQIYRDHTGQRHKVHAAGAHLFAGKMVGWFNHERGLPFVQIGGADERVLSYWHEPFLSEEGNGLDETTDNRRMDWGMRMAAAFFIYVQRHAPGEDTDALLVNIVGAMPKPLSPSAKEFLRHLERLHWLHGTEVSSRQIADDVEARIEEYNKNDFS